MPIPMLVVEVVIRTCRSLRGPSSHRPRQRQRQRQRPRQRHCECTRVTRACAFNNISLFPHRSVSSQHIIIPAINNCYFVQSICDTFSHSGLFSGVRVEGKEHLVRELSACTQAESFESEPPLKTWLYATVLLYCDVTIPALPNRPTVACVIVLFLPYLGRCDARRY